MKYILALAALVLMGTNTRAQQPFQQPADFVVDDWVNPVTGDHETIAHWPPTNSAPSTIWYCQHGFTNSEPGQPLEVIWSWPNSLLTTRRVIDFGPPPVLDPPRFVMLLPYSPQYVFRLIPRDKAVDHFPSPLHPPAELELAPAYPDGPTGPAIRVLSVNALPQNHAFTKALREKIRKPKKQK